MKRNASFFLSPFVSMVVIASSVAPAFAQLATPPVTPTPPAATAPPASASVTVAPPQVAPLLSAITVISIATSTAAITWATDKSANAQIEYGLTTNYGSQSFLDANLALTHSATLSGLQSNTIYHYRVKSADSSGNMATSEDNTFTTASVQVVLPVDTTPPVISGVAEASVSSILATVIWSTDELATSTLEYGTTPSYGSQASLDAGALLVHTGIILNLSPGATYYYCIHATDLFGNTANSCGHTFKTAAAIITPISVVTPHDTTPPDVSLVTLASITTSTISITWATNEPANGEVEYGPTASYGSITNYPASFDLTDGATITGLEPNTTYHYRIRTSDIAGNVAYGPDNTFITGALPVVVPVPPPDVRPPVISDILQKSVAPYDAVITWKTDELATSRIRYGAGTQLDHTLALSASVGLDHAGTLAELVPNTTYHYCIDATDVYSNTASSCGHSFTTALPPIVADIVPPNLSLIAVDSVGTSAATLAWVTDEPADSHIEYGTTTNYGASTVLDTNLSLTHSVTLQRLTAGTTYHYRVRSSDAAGNLSVSADATFSTNTLPEISVEIQTGGTVQTPASTPIVTTTATTTPTSVIFSSIETQAIATSTATITWATDLPSDSQIEYGVSSLLGSPSLIPSPLVTSHSITLANLTSDTNYFFRVLSRLQGASSVTVSESHEFNTLSVPIPTTVPPTMSSIQTSSVGTSTAMISWATDKNTTARVFYGIATTYPQPPLSDLMMGKSHSFALTNLTPTVAYHYRVESTDSYGNTVDSEDAVFTTTAIPAASLSINANLGANVSAATSSQIIASSSVGSSIISSSTVSVLSTSSILSPSPTFVIASPAKITELGIANVDQTSVTLSWNTSSSLSDISEEYDIRYGNVPITDSGFQTASSSQATLVLYGDIAPTGTARTYIVAGLNPGTTYYFAIKSKYPSSDWSLVSNIASTATIASLNPSAASLTQNVDPPTLTAAVGNDSQVTLAWNDPNESLFVRTVIVEKAGGYPTSPSDGQVVYEGDSKTFTQVGVTNGGGTNYYALYSYDRAKDYSVPVHVAVAPQTGQMASTIHGTPDIVKPIDYHFATVLSKGSTEIEVAHLQGMLARYGDYPEKLVTSYFGTLTENALKKFQAQHGIPQTGVTDQKTQILLNVASLSDATLSVPRELALSATDLHLGMINQDVSELQQFLAQAGSYPNAQITGYFGSQTQQAVVNFQKKHGITPASGYVGRITRHTMEVITGY